MMLENTTFDIAFWGRSNVGKSSLINAIAGQKVMRTSKTPGCTKGLYALHLSKKLNLVDMPGYGYATASKVDKARWAKEVRDYFNVSNNLLCVFVLIDGLVGIKPADQEAFCKLDRLGVPFHIILTKCDKRGASAQMSQLVHEHCQMYGNYCPMPVPSSSKDQDKIRSVKLFIEETAKEYQRRFASRRPHQDDLWEN